MTPLAQEWLEKGERDFETAEWVAQAPKALEDSVCFHAHAGVEKYLKARLQEAGIAFPKAHDLEVLLNLVLPVQPTWNALRPDLKLLNRFCRRIQASRIASDLAGCAGCPEEVRGGARDGSVIVRIELVRHLTGA